MGAQANAAPVIIKRKKVVGGAGHHGGAWKVAYADFVTAMMAFFMLMWLLNATTEQQRKGIADYFTPTIPINRVSGGGDGAFGGDSIFSEETLPQNGTGGISTDVSASTQQQAELEELEALLIGGGGESQVMENALRHIVTRITDEGLVIEVYDLENIPLFVGETAEPVQLLRDLSTVIAEATRSVTNEIAVGGHVRANPIVLARSPVWELSAARATAMRVLLEEAGIKQRRIQRVTGHADRKQVVPDPMGARNNRLEIILLRNVPRN